MLAVAALAPDPTVAAAAAPAVSLAALARRRTISAAHHDTRRMFCCHWCMLLPPPPAGWPGPDGSRGLFSGPEYSGFEAQPEASAHQGSLRPGFAMHKWLIGRSERRRPPGALADLPDGHVHWHANVY